VFIAFGAVPLVIAATKVYLGVRGSPASVEPGDAPLVIFPAAATLAAVPH
jgi:hypothetical protein